MKGCLSRIVVFFAICIGIGVPVESYLVSKIGKIPPLFSYSNQPITKEESLKRYEANKPRLEWLEARRNISGLTPLYTIPPALLLTFLFFARSKK